MWIADKSRTKPTKDLNLLRITFGAMDRACDLYSNKWKIKGNPLPGQIDEGEGWRKDEWHANLEAGNKNALGSSV